MPETHSIWLHDKVIAEEWICSIHNIDSEKFDMEHICNLAHIEDADMLLKWIRLYAMGTAMKRSS